MYGSRPHALLGVGDEILLEQQPISGPVEYVASQVELSKTPNHFVKFALPSHPLHPKEYCRHPRPARASRGFHWVCWFAT